MLSDDDIESDYSSLLGSWPCILRPGGYPECSRSLGDDGTITPRLACGIPREKRKRGMRKMALPEEGRAKKSRAKRTGRERGEKRSQRHLGMSRTRKPSPRSQIYPLPGVMAAAAMSGCSRVRCGYASTAAPCSSRKGATRSCRREPWLGISVPRTTSSTTSRKEMRRSMLLCRREVFLPEIRLLRWKTGSQISDRSTSSSMGLLQGKRNDRNGELPYSEKSSGRSTIIPFLSWTDGFVPEVLVLLV